MHENVHEHVDYLVCQAKPADCDLLCPKDVWKFVVQFVEGMKFCHLEGLIIIPSGNS